jgi:hypothetical protein
MHSSKYIFYFSHSEKNYNFSQKEKPQMEIVDLSGLYDSKNYYTIKFLGINY